MYLFFLFFNLTVIFARQKAHQNKSRNKKTQKINPLLYPLLFDKILIINIHICIRNDTFISDTINSKP